MKNSAFRVETTPRRAQWRMEHLLSVFTRTSDPFKIGKWNWYLSVEKSKVKLFPSTTSNYPHAPIASFIIRVISSVDGRSITHSEIKDKVLTFMEGFVWTIQVPHAEKFMIEVEFLDLKTASTKSRKPSSIWAEGFSKQKSHANAIESQVKRLTEGTHTDIIINVSGGSLRAHRAVLTARSKVFGSMFSHNLQEKESSTINISDMSLDSCQVFLNYLYGIIKHKEFLNHRLSLLHAADKYDISDLRDACQESLVEDIDTKNVLERLENACLYKLVELKTSCMKYLLKFGKIYEIWDDFNTILRNADRDMIVEVFHEVMLHPKLPVRKKRKFDCFEGCS